MTRPSATTALASALMVLALLLAAQGVLAADGQVPAAIALDVPAHPAVVSGAHDVPCGDTTVAATVTEANGATVDAVELTWELVGTPDDPVLQGDHMVDTSSTTDAQGVAMARVHLACLSGVRDVTARFAAAPGVPQIQSGVKLRVVVAPATSVAEDGPLGLGSVAIGAWLAGAFALGLVVGWARLRRRGVSRWSGRPSR